LNNDLVDNYRKVKQQSSVDIHNQDFKEIYVYRDVNKEVAENVFYKLINTSTNIFNKHTEFKLMGYGLDAVFERSLAKNKPKKVMKKNLSLLPTELKTEESEYSETNTQNNSARYKTYDIQQKKLSLRRKFNNSTINHSISKNLDITFPNRKSLT
jgi:hypothetical protein